MMRKIAGKSISDALGNEVASFLAKYARDVVDLSFAISMAIVWCRLASTPGYQPERCTVDSNGEGRRPVPRPTLAVLLLYAPHFFRFHEEHGLAAYVHIFRYTHSLYAADADHDEDAFYIAKTDINQSKILQIVGDLHLQEEDWLEIVPPSFEGSLLTMPNHYGHIAPRSEETTASLMLPDVYTLSLPDYRNNKIKGHGLVTRNILAHKRWVPSHVLSDGAVTKKYKGRKYLKMSALRRYSDDKCPQLWISPKLTVQMPWFDVDPPKYSVLPQPQPLRGAGPEPSGQTQQPPSTMIPKEPIAEFSQKLVVQFRVAQNKGLISPNVCLGDSGLVWEGMQEEIKCARGLHSDISIDQMVAADAAVQANLLTEKDKSLLHRLLADLEGDSGVPRCLRPFKNAIDPFEEAPTKTSIAALIQEMGQSAETAMNRT
ncbi:hypothetical protein CGMCC3_g10366 [Colletotrichum fructicola]|nr:uncharacterized protein CGMCC3_g10366 [Colletotrichum fructicola]KAE9573483.1 hypothetical protein CGMCC3_g10366 [Colletotrichum fructicola]KAF4485143.1 hypothetical protein CGGC5_v006864 [Colletotrichum fructicola Nara gc5]